MYVEGVITPRWINIDMDNRVPPDIDGRVKEEFAHTNLIDI